MATDAERILLVREITDNAKFGVWIKYYLLFLGMVGLILVMIVLFCVGAIVWSVDLVTFCRALGVTEEELQAVQYWPYVIHERFILGMHLIAGVGFVFVLLSGIGAWILKTINRSNKLLLEVHKVVCDVPAKPTSGTPAQW